MSDSLRFGRYEAFEELGAGAMGKVYLAVDPLIDRMVAIKVIRADLLEPAEREEFLERFRLEVRAAARCAHPNIVAVHDFADHEAMPYIVMEHVPGRTLSAIFRGDAGERAAATSVLTSAMLAVLEGLQAAHALGVIHRDIKPGNIMITPRGQVKITDFGIAKFGGGDLTQVGGVVGTPAYMSPEQAKGGEVDPRADLFSVAAILYEILLGRAPFAGRNITDTLLRLTGPAPAELGVLEGTALGEVLREGLAKDCDARFSTALDFATALRQALAPPIIAPPIAAPPIAAPPVAPLALPEVVAPGPQHKPDDPRQRLAALRGKVAPPAVAAPPAAVPPLATARREMPERAPQPVAAPLGASGRFALSTAQGAAATQVLAFLVGPIARILVMRAAAQAGNAEEFVTRLVAHASGAEAAGLRRDLTKLF